MPRTLDAPVHLAERSVLHLDDGQGIEVQCRHGVLWITQSGDPEDTVVHAGEAFVVTRPGLTLISALLGPAVLVLQPGRVTAPPLAASLPLGLELHKPKHEKPFCPSY